MEIQALILAYTAAALVAMGVTAAFAASIESTLFRLLPDGTAADWGRFVKFAVFVASFAGGVPAPSGGFIDRSAPAPPPPGASEGLVLVMNSAIGALMAASWILLIFFVVTLAATAAARAYGAVQRYRSREAEAAAGRAESAKLAKLRQDRSDSHGEPAARRR